MANISKLSLAALRDWLLSQVREQVFWHNSKSDGTGTMVASVMIYIPRFRVPAGIWEGWPPVEIKSPGFWFDKYPCSQPDATSQSRGSTSPNSPGLVAAVSQAGVVPWTDINQPNSKIVCSNRKINGRSCHLITLEEARAVMFVKELIGHVLYGNNYWGRDYRDPASWEYYGEPDPVVASYTKQYSPTGYSRVLTGTGPNKWAHNGLAIGGAMDFIGIWQWTDFEITDGRYQAIKKAAINDVDGITAADTAIVIDGVEKPEFWPVNNGLVLIKAEGTNTDEYVIYDSFVDNGDGTYTLSGCQRGQKGTAASAHANDALVQQITDYCVIPGGWTAKIADAGLNNTANPATFTYSDLVLGPGGANPAVNDVLQCQNEQLIITAVNGNSITVSRGANGSTVAAHANGNGIARISPQMTNDNVAATGDYGAYQFNRIVSFRTEPELLALGLPASVSSGGSSRFGDGFWLRVYGQRAGLVGGSWVYGSLVARGWAVALFDPPSSSNFSIAPRAALRL